MYIKQIEKILRLRLYWIVIFPLIVFSFVFLYIYLPDLEIGYLPDLEDALGTITVIFFFVPIFPSFITGGLGFKDVELYTSALYLSLPFYFLYILFIIFINKLNRRLLFLVSAVVFLLAILATKGCIHFIDNMPSF